MQHLEQELADLKDRLLVMGSHAERAVQEAVQALLTRDDALAQKVREDDTVLDRLEVELDDRAVNLLAQALLATDLRLVIATTKITQNLERIGDEATKVARRAHDLNQEPPLKVAPDLPRLAELARQMLTASLDAFVRADPGAARALIVADQQVDGLHRLIRAQLERVMMDDPQTIKRCLHLLVAAKSLERIADHAKNVAEEVVYHCEAQDIRHAKHLGTDTSRG